MDLFIGIQNFQIHYSNIYEYYCTKLCKDMGWHNHTADNFSLKEQF